MSQKMFAYVGSRDEAEDFTLDNPYLLRGYRINHDTCGKTCKSLFTCHNESVNVWSHIAGVIIFIFLFVLLCSVVVPSHFWFAGQLSSDFQSVTKGTPLANPYVFVSSQIEEITKTNLELSDLKMTPNETANVSTEKSAADDKFINNADLFGDSLGELLD